MKTVHHLSVLVACAFPCAVVADENAAPADELARQKVMVGIPAAPEGYRRPKDWKPVLYPRDLKTLAKEESAGHVARAKALMARVDKMNREGKWHADAKSIDAHKCPEWFIDAKLGIFIDWGPWSMASWCPYVKGARLYPDWYELRCHNDPAHVAYHEKNWGKDFKRDHFLDLFKASKFDAPALMKVFRACGAKYVIPFLKHHGGYCLWDSSFTFRDSMDQGPKRDLTKEMVDACRAEGLKFGIYESQAGEWEYPILQADGSIAMYVQSSPELKPYTSDMEWRASGKVAVRDFVREYIVPQAVEFIDKYDPDIFWGDYDWTTEAAKNGSYDIAAYMYNHAEGRKEVAVNDRLGKGTPEEVAEWTKKRSRLIGCRTLRGDYYTDESGDTAKDLSPATWHPWEECTGVSLAYGNHWQVDNPESVLSEKDFICLFSDIVAKGGNLLLLVNLDPQGVIPEMQKSRLLQIGKWLEKNGEAIYGTRICAPYSTEKVNYTQSKDGTIIYAIVKKQMTDVVLKCALPDVVRVSLIGTPDCLKTDKSDGGVHISIPQERIADGLPFVLKCNVGTAVFSRATKMETMK